MIPVVAQGMLGYRLFLTLLANLLMACLIDIRKIGIYMDTGGGNGFHGFTLAIFTDNLLLTFCHTCGFLQYGTVLPVVRFGFFPITF